MSRRWVNFHDRSMGALPGLRSGKLPRTSFRVLRLLRTLSYIMDTPYWVITMGFPEGYISLRLNLVLKATQFFA